MPDPYQQGSDEDWLHHSNDELARMVKNRDRQIRLLRLLSLVLLIGLGWVVYRYTQKIPIQELWKF